VAISKRRANCAPPLIADVRQQCDKQMHAVATSRKKSVVARLASWFHQDFRLMGMDPDHWGIEFLKSLTPNERRVLRVELQQLLGTFPGKSTKGLRNAWVRLGAESWPRNVNLRSAIDSWVKALE
jgi:hypothetical protein